MVVGSIETISLAVQARKFLTTILHLYNFLDLNIVVHPSHGSLQSRILLLCCALCVVIYLFCYYIEETYFFKLIILSFCVATSFPKLLLKGLCVVMHDKWQKSAGSILYSSFIQEGISYFCSWVTIFLCLSFK